MSLDIGLKKYDRIFFIVREVELSQASALIQVKYSFFFFFIESLSIWYKFLVLKLIHGHREISCVQVAHCPKPNVIEEK